MIIRELKDCDLDALIRFFSSNNIPANTINFHPFPLTETQAALICLHQSLDKYYACIENDEIVGISMLRGWEEGYEIPSFGILIDINHQGRGYGRLLTNWTVEQARLMGNKYIRLSVFESNLRARKIYEALGFELIDHQPENFGDQENKLIMRKGLGE